jgi:hypothetical protein
MVPFSRFAAAAQFLERDKAVIEVSGSKQYRRALVWRRARADQTRAVKATKPEVVVGV